MRYVSLLAVGVWHGCIAIGCGSEAPSFNASNEGAGGGASTLDVNAEAPDGAEGATDSGMGPTADGQALGVHTSASPSSGQPTTDPLAGGNTSTAATAGGDISVSTGATSSDTTPSPPEGNGASESSGQAGPTVGQTNQSVCGDGALTLAEECDDGNTVNGDGCSSRCQLEPNASCPEPGEACLIARCGDGLLSTGESCDDGNPSPGDGCSAQCSVEGGFVCSAPGQPCTPDGRCDDSELECAGSCVNPQTSNEFCGATGSCTGSSSGVSCSTGEQCLQGVCRPLCGDGLVLCNDSCVDAQSDAVFCGATNSCLADERGEVCPESATCIAGVCEAGCAADEVRCGDTCVDPTTSTSHCGARAECQAQDVGIACRPGESCQAGACVDGCRSSQILCDGSCVDPAQDDAFCGASGTCEGGARGQVCTGDTACESGACRRQCSGTTVRCGPNDECVDPQTSNTFCGASGDCSGDSAGEACGQGQECEAGSCHVQCKSNTVRCGDECVDPKSDPEYCGVSADCTGGSACRQGELCANGSCELDCPAGTLACGNRCVNPNSSAEHCGASANCEGNNAGQACGSGELCSMGACRRWSAPVQVNQVDAQCSSAQVGLDETGNAVFAWSDYTAASKQRIIARQRRGSQWTAQEVLSSGTVSLDLSLAVAPNGSAVLAYAQNDGQSDEIAVRMLTPPTWGSEEPVNDAMGPTMYRPKAGIAANGDAAVVWEQIDWSADVVLYSVEASRRRSGSWGAQTRVNGGKVGTQQPTMAMTPQGTVFAVWLEREDMQTRLMSNVASASGNWRSSPITVLPDIGYTVYPSLSNNGRGDARVAWSSSADSPGLIRSIAFWSATGTWESASEPASFGHQLTATEPSVRLDGEGNALTVWLNGHAFSGASNDASFFDAKAGAWSSSQAISTESSPGRPGLALAPGGWGLAVWARAAGELVAASFHRDGAQWSPPQSTGASGASTSAPAVAVTDDGRAVAVWYAGSSPNIFASFLE